MYKTVVKEGGEMPRAPDKKVIEAHELYSQGLKLKEIATKLGKPEGTIRRWKSTYNWDENEQSERSDNKANAQSERSDKNVSWIKIENEYVTDIRKRPCSLEKLAKKYSIPIQTIKDKSAKEKWSEKRTKYKLNTNQKVIEKTSLNAADRITKLLMIADIASEKAEQALAELETYAVKSKTKTKTVEYKDKKATGKPTKEVIEEKEDIVEVSGPIDRQGLLFVTNAIKNIKDIYSVEDNGADKDKGDQAKDNIASILEQINPIGEDDVNE